jgi:hypothetical protein
MLLQQDRWFEQSKEEVQHEMITPINKSIIIKLLLILH